MLALQSNHHLAHILSMEQTEERARTFGPPQFEEAARTLLTIRPDTATAVELMRHRRGDVRGRAILECLRHGHAPWALRAVDKGAPHARAYFLP